MFWVVFQTAGGDVAALCLWRTYLHSDLRQVDLQRQLLPAVHVRVVGLLEGSLQLVELEGGERRPVAAVLLLGVVVVGQFAVSVRGVRAQRRIGRAARAAATCAQGTASGRTLPRKTPHLLHLVDF